MADIRISQLTELGTAPSDSDVLIINDVSVNTTKKITFGNLLTNFAENVIDSASGARCTGDFVIDNELILGGDLTTTAAINAGSLTIDQIDTTGGTLTIGTGLGTATTLKAGEIDTNQIGNLDGETIQIISNLKFQDGDEARFGASGDLKIYHDGSNSYIEEGGTGNLLIRSNGSGIVLRNKSNDLNFISCLTATGETKLFYNGDNANDVRLKTFDSGCDITGFTRTDQLRVTTPGATPTSSTPGQNGEIRYDTSYIYIYQSGNWYRATLDPVP